jgi:threonine dehydrogenase-like Zn-dependent dehydrogenase
MKGKAAIFTDVGKPLEFREYPLPEVEPGAMLIKISMANICGSDLHFLRGQGPGIPRGIPQVLGHEMTGAIARLGGPGQTDSLGQPLQEGDRVVYAYFRGCGTCWMCLTGGPGCPNRYAHWIGVSSDDPPHFNGAYAEYYYLRPGQWVFKVPDDLPDHLVSPVNCALAEVIYGLQRLGIVLGDSVVIQGAGGLGLYATAVAREMGAGQIIVLDKVKERLDLAQAFGADQVINVDELDWPQRLAVIKELTDGRGADVVAEFVGSPSVVQEGIELSRFGGRYLWIGNINLGLKGDIDPGQVVRGSRTVLGLVVYEAWVIPRALQFLQRTRSKYPYERIISHTFPLERINDAFEQAFQRRAMRVSLIP